MLRRQEAIRRHEQIVHVESVAREAGGRAGEGVLDVEGVAGGCECLVFGFGVEDPVLVDSEGGEVEAEVCGYVEEGGREG